MGALTNLFPSSPGGVLAEHPLGDPKWTWERKPGVEMLLSWPPLSSEAPLWCLTRLKIRILGGAWGEWDANGPARAVCRGTCSPCPRGWGVWGCRGCLIGREG